MAMAVRIARAATGRDKVAFCGYHGWHDWYLAANLPMFEETDEWEPVYYDNGEMSREVVPVYRECRNDALRNVLLPGLNANGVPCGLAGTAHVFHHNNVTELTATTSAHPDLAAIIIEVQRSEAPTQAWLDTVRREATRLGAVLIVDEITSGWRLEHGGAHLRYGLEPDMAVFAKALGNGYPIAAIIGKRSVMEAAQTTFISSTNWTERIGPVAALAAIKKMEEISVHTRVNTMGEVIMTVLEEAAAQYGLEASIGHHDMPCMVHCHFGEDLPLRTLMVQEFLRRDILFGGDLYVTAAHTLPYVEQFVKAVQEVFPILADAQAVGDAESKLLGPVCHDRFRRLTA